MASTVWAFSRHAMVPFPFRGLSQLTTSTGKSGAHGFSQLPRRHSLHSYTRAHTAHSKFFNSGRGANAKGFGYGNPLFDNRGCFIENAPAGYACTGNTSQLTEFDIGYWYRILSGDFGSLRTGLQYSYIERSAYRGRGGLPTAFENIIYAAIRYYPYN
jgi:hypothetical protein